MSSNALRSLLGALMGCALLLSACGGGDSATPETNDVVDDVDDADTDGTVEPATDDIAEAVDDVAVDTIEPVDLNAPVQPGQINSLILALTGAAPTEAELDCLTVATEDDGLLTEVFNGFGSASYQLSPEGFTALAVNTHDCVANEALAASLSSLSVLEGDGADAFQQCMAEQIGDETNGDLAYTGLSALMVGFDIPEGAAQFAFEAATTCVTREDLVEQVAFNTESNLAFTIEVDRQCVADGLDEDVMNAFWASFILREGDGVEVADLIDSCTEAFDSGLPQEIPADFVPFAGDGVLAGVDPFARNGVYTEAPALLLEDGVDYQAILTTSDGDIVIDLYEDTAPATVNSFVALARDGFYDGTVFHRVLEGFMAQAGDPTGTSTGGPGYSFADEDTAMTPIDSRGVLAMANSGPDTNGSQFFITFEPADFLTGLHAVFGEVIEGDEVLAEVDLRDPDAPTSRGEQLISITIVEA